jgi:hypothetical protein
VIDTLSEQTAWAAGFYEGEGSISFKLQRGRGPGAGPGARAIGVTVTQKDREPLDMFRAAVGFGAVCRLGRGMYSWNAGKLSDVERLVALFWPYLSTRRRIQAMEALRSYYEYKGLGRGHRGALKTHCSHGHELTAENTSIRVHVRRGVPYDERCCRQCDRDRSAARRSPPRLKVVNE